METATITPLEAVVEPHFLTQGAFAVEDERVEWTLWAPEAPEVLLAIHDDGRPEIHSMHRDDLGYHTAQLARIGDGTRYAYQIGGCEYPDPASRRQPDGVHTPSAVFFHEDFAWSDAAWRGVSRDDLVLYELHIGTFTPKGTLDAAIGRLPALAELGITAVELMPVAQFAGERNWGYDGVYPYAVQNSYGGPRALQRFVDAAHAEGLAVFLDVVYNHFGPEGNYLRQFGPYFTDHYKTPWGEAINFDGPDSDPVRRFIVDAARLWIRDFHVDGLRLDAVHAIFDSGARHILAEIREAVHCVGAAQSRRVYVFAETTQNDVRLIDPQQRHGDALDGVWNDDFHHAVRTVLTGELDGYYQDFGRPQQLVKAFNDVYVYDGGYSRFRRRRHGSRVENRNRRQFVAFVQNHDQVGNRAQGDRLIQNVPDAAARLSLGLLLINPCVPLLFMGEEYGECRPFPFFCSFSDPELVEAVRKGRREEFAEMHFDWGCQIPDPDLFETFMSAKLAWEWPEGTREAGFRHMVADLLAARRNWPPLIDPDHTSARLSEPIRSTWEPDEACGPILVVERGTEPLVALANLGPTPVSFSEELLDNRILLLSTEAPRYGGSRGSDQSRGDLEPYELALFGRRDWLA